MIYPDAGLDWPIPYSAVQDICNSESCRLTAYLCPAGVWTIGWGDTDDVYEGETITQEEADQRLLRALKRFTAGVLALCKVKPNANQLGALTSFAYNVGLGALARSQVLIAHNAGRPLATAKAFSLYDKARDPKTKQLVVLPGLVKRRALESALYLTPIATAAVVVNDAAGAIEAPTEALPPAVEPLPMPQAVAPAPSLLKNPLALTGAATAATSAINALSGAADQAQSVTSTVSTVATNAQTTVSNVRDAAGVAHAAVTHASGFLGVEPWMLVSGVLAAVSVAVVFYLRKQRAAGAI